MARYTINQLNRLADRLQDDGELTIQEVINLVGDCQHLTVDLSNMTEERDALAAELKAVKAGLPRWREGQGSHRGAWVLGVKWSGDVGFVSRAEGRWLGHAPTRICLLYDTREAAMLAVTEALGLPPCEVEE